MPHPTLRTGMSGPAVLALQQALHQAGNILALDGTFGPSTKAAVVAIQRSAGLSADGVVGPDTWGGMSSPCPVLRPL